MNNNTPAFPLPTDHNGRSYVITGAASGIGRRTAELLAAENAKLTLADISPDVAQVAEALGAQFIIGDLTDAANCTACANIAKKAYGGIDGAVIAAGVVSSKFIADTDEPDFKRVMDINLTAPFLMTKALLPHIRVSKSAGGFVFIGSKDAFDAVAGVSAYSVSKAALLHFARTLAVEEGKNGVRSNVIHPDVVIDGSSLWNEELRNNRASKHGVDPDKLSDHYKARNALGVALSTDDMAYAASFLLSARARAISGAVLTVDGGFAPAFPR